MDEITFQWDDLKNKENQQKHGVSFEEARSVFYDDRGVEFYDDAHSEWEDHFLVLGVSARLRLLMVCHCHREDSNVIRIISARVATKTEQKYYPWEKS